MTLEAHVETDEHGRPHPPAMAGEAETLLGFLEHHRATLAWKCRDVPAEGLRASTAATSMTLGGLLKHLAGVEDYWFTHVVRGGSGVGPWESVDWDDDPDWDWHSAADDSPEELRRLWEEACQRSRGAVEEALANGGLEQEVADPAPEGGPSLRWVLVHMIEEYARHNGHADLLREAWDGETGE